MALSTSRACFDATTAMIHGTGQWGLRLLADEQLKARFMCCTSRTLQLQEARAPAEQPYRGLMFVPEIPPLPPLLRDFGLG